MEVSDTDHVALLMCIALSGYHSLSTYQWRESGKVMVSEVYPLLYISNAGMFTCTVNYEEKSIERIFEVTGNFAIQPLYVHTCFSGGLPQKILFKPSISSKCRWM